MCPNSRKTLRAAEGQGLLFWVESLVEERCQGSEPGFWNIHGKASLLGQGRVEAASIPSTRPVISGSEPVGQSVTVWCVE